MGELVRRLGRRLRVGNDETLFRLWVGGGGCLGRCVGIFCARVCMRVGVWVCGCVFVNE